METSTVQSIKLIIVAFTGLPKDALHIYVGLAVFLIAAIVFRRPFLSIVPWISVFAIAAVGEMLDMRDDLESLGRWRWDASLHDILNTLFWPTTIFLLARIGMFVTPSDHNT